MKTSSYEKLSLSLSLSLSSLLPPSSLPSRRGASYPTTATWSTVALNTKYILWKLCISGQWHSTENFLSVMSINCVKATQLLTKHIFWVNAFTKEQSVRHSIPDMDVECVLTWLGSYIAPPMIGYEYSQAISASIPSRRFRTCTLYIRNDDFTLLAMDATKMSFVVR